MNRFIKHLLLVVFSIFLSSQISANDTFFSIEKSCERNNELGNAGGDAFKHIDLVKAEQRYGRSYARTGKYGFNKSLDDIAKQYGEKGRELVKRLEREAEEILATLKPGQKKMKGDPVLSGIIDTKGSSNEIFFGRNLKTPAEIDEFVKNAHPLIKERYLLHMDKLNKGLVKAPIDDIKRAGTKYTGDKVESFLIHSEVVALDKAIKARGSAFKETDLKDFLLHNKQLFKGKKGVPPRCVNCWHQTDGIKVIGND